MSTDFGAAWAPAWLYMIKIKHKLKFYVPGILYSSSHHFWFHVECTTEKYEHYTPFPLNCNKQSRWPVEKEATVCKLMKPPEESLPLNAAKSSLSGELNLKDLDEVQQKIVKMAIKKIKGKQQLKLFIHGPPGSGKTTVTKAITWECRKRRMGSILIAVTGVAAKQRKGHIMHKYDHT